MVSIIESFEVEGSGSLPSDLVAEYEASQDTTDAESTMQMVLSALAHQVDIAKDLVIQEQEQIPDWIWNFLTQGRCEPPYRYDQTDESTPQWISGLLLLHKLLPKLTPFEVHAIANQSIVFTEGSTTHGSLCMLLCVWALNNSPSGPITQRWKRWQSLSYETVRLYQNYGVELVDIAVPLWAKHVFPAVQTIVQRLPSEAYHLAFIAALIGTTSNLVVRDIDLVERDAGKADRQVLSHVVQLLRLVSGSVSQFGYTETWIWSHPWRMYHERTYIASENVDVEFLQRKNDFAWWAAHAYRHEQVAGMDTSWDEFGISLLALVAFDERPLVLSRRFVWKTWFPHVAILLQNTGTDHALLQHLPMSLLDNLLLTTSEQCMDHVSSLSTAPDSPFETIQQLSNRILVPQQEGKKRKQPELQPQSNAGRIVALMKALLSRYQPVNQVKIIRKLVHDCSHHGLRAKLIDLLRPVVFEDEAADALWSYLSTFIKDLVAHIDHRDQTLINGDSLVSKVEIYVSVITMIQVYCLSKQRLPRKIKGSSLREFYKILRKMLRHWLTDTMALPPDDYYRLYLLEGSLEKVSNVLVDTYKRKNGIMDTNNDSNHDPSTSSSSSSSFSTSSSFMEGNGNGVNVPTDDYFQPIVVTEAPRQTAVVGEIDLFS